MSVQPTANGTGRRTSQSFRLTLSFAASPRCPLCGDQLLPQATTLVADMLLCEPCASAYPMHLACTIACVMCPELADHWLVSNRVAAWTPSPDRRITAMQLLARLAPDQAEKVASAELPTLPRLLRGALLQPAELSVSPQDLLTLESMAAKVPQPADQQTGATTAAVCNQVAGAQPKAPAETYQLALPFVPAPYHEPPFDVGINQEPDNRLDHDQT